jgi:outer membrane protein
LRTPKLVTTGILVSLTLTCASASAFAAQQTLQLSQSLSIAQIKTTSSSAKRISVADILEQSKSWMPGTESCAIKADQGKNLSLTKTLQIVLCQHPQLVEARARIEEQMAEVNLSKLERRPDVQTVLQYTTEKDRQANFSDATRKGVTAGLSANWVLFDFGQQSANIRAANRQLDSAIAIEKSVSLTVLREALEQYISASTAWANLVAAQKTLKIAQRTEEFARARYESKVGNQIDQLQAKTAVHQAQLGLLQAQGEWEDAKTTLAVAMGLPEQQDLTIDSTEPDPAIDVPEIAEAGTAQMERLRQHPSVKAFESQILAIEERREASRLSYIGQVSLDFFTGRVNDEIAGFQTSRTNAIGNIRASIPLFTSDIQQAQELKLLKQQTSVQAEQEEAIRELQKELKQARQGLLLSRNTHTISNQLLNTAELAQEMALGRFKAGVGSIIELLDAQTALTNARRQQAGAKADALRQQVRLLLVSGQFQSPASN